MKLRVRFTQSLSILFCLALSATAQTNAEKSEHGEPRCPGLHAGIRAQIIPPHTEEPSVMLKFSLLNDSEQPIDAQVQSWRIEIDGKQLNDRDNTEIFGSGPRPVGKWWLLKPGETIEFGAALSTSRYFLPNGQYKVRWRGAAFQSPAIAVTITPSSH